MIDTGIIHPGGKGPARVKFSPISQAKLAQKGRKAGEKTFFKKNTKTSKKGLTGEFGTPINRLNEQGHSGRGTRHELLTTLVEDD